MKKKFYGAVAEENMILRVQLNGGREMGNGGLMVTSTEGLVTKLLEFLGLEEEEEEERI